MKLRLLTATIGSLALLSYLYLLTREYRSSRCADRGDFDCAISWEPSNAEYYRGRARQKLFTRSDLPVAIKDLTKALARNPRDSETWMDLADAEAGSGDMGSAVNAARQAIAVDFSTPSIHWRAATYFLIADDFAQAKSQMRLAVQGNHYLSYEATRVAWSARNDKSDVFEVLPPTQYAYAEAMHYFIENSETEAAIAAWDHLLNAGPLIEPHNDAAESKSTLEWKHAKALVDYLLNKSEFEKANKVWEDVCRSSPHANYCDPLNLVNNGSFEEPLHDKGDLAGFDWRILMKGIRRTSSDSFEGQNALEIDFSNSAEDDSTIMQWLNLPPNTPLLVHAMYKPDIFATPSRVELAIKDRSGIILERAPILTERRGWTELSLALVTPSDTRGFKIALISSGPVNGSLLIDDVHIGKRE